MNNDKQVNEIIDLISEILIKYMIEKNMMKVKESENSEVI